MNFIGTILNQITPDDPLPSEPMTMDMMRKKTEQEFPNPDSSISIEERAFLALKEYQQEIRQQKKQLLVVSKNWESCYLHDLQM